MALSIPTLGKKKPVNLQTEQQQVATPTALKAPVVKAPPKVAVPPPPSPPRETAPTPPSTYGGPRPPGAPGTVTPTPKPTTPGAGAPPVGTYDVPTPPPMGGAAATPETVTMTMDDQTAGAIGDGGAGGLWEAAKPSEAAPAGPPSEDAFDAQVRQLMADLLAGKGMNVNTAEEEALIRELMQDKTGQALVEQRARMGRAGFGASGALAAMEGDIRRQAAQGATQETLALRRQAQQEAIDNALRAIGVDVEKRREGREATFDEEFLNALKSYMGQESTGPDQSGGPLAGTSWENVPGDYEKGGLAEVAKNLPADLTQKMIEQLFGKNAAKASPELVKATFGPEANPDDYIMVPPNPTPVRIR